MNTNAFFFLLAAGGLVWFTARQFKKSTPSDITAAGVATSDAISAAGQSVATVFSGANGDSYVITNSDQGASVDYW